MSVMKNSARKLGLGVVAALIVGALAGPTSAQMGPAFAQGEYATEVSRFCSALLNRLVSEFPHHLNILYLSRTYGQVESDKAGVDTV